MPYGFLEFLLASESNDWDLIRNEQIICILIHHKCRYETNVYSDPHGFAFILLSWVRIRIHLAVMDPDPLWECGSGYRSMEIDRSCK
jgi:hypothetical protein